MGTTLLRLPKSTRKSAHAHPGSAIACTALTAAAGAQHGRLGGAPTVVPAAPLHVAQQHVLRQAPRSHLPL